MLGVRGNVEVTIPFFLPLESNDATSSKLISIVTWLTSGHMNAVLGFRSAELKIEEESILECNDTVENMCTKVRALVQIEDGRWLYIPGCCNKIILD